MIEVYHSSKIEVRHPEVKYSRKELDFGPGFYFTTLRSQAEAYARRFTRLKQDAWLNIYDFDESFPNKTRQFDVYDEDWLDFVAECRNGNPVGDYDIIIGSIADDEVFDTLALFFNGLYSKAEALERLRYKKPNIQYCIRSQNMLDRCLTFKNSVRL